MLKINSKPVFLFTMLALVVLVTAFQTPASASFDYGKALQTTLTPVPASSPTQVSTQLAASPVEQPAGTYKIETRVSPKDGMEEVFVPAGEFIMGTNDTDAKITIEGGRAFPEIPSFKYTLDSYWIDKYEVTNGQWAKCVADGACQEPNLMRSTTRSAYYPLPEFANYPVLYVSWFMAKGYCEWAGRRLPTEAEWEKAARGTDGRRYPWGNEAVDDTRANFCDINCPKPHANPLFNDGYTDTAPVGSFPAGVSPYGAMDMIGNVWEWTSTIPEWYPYDETDGREAEVGFERVWRGGTWTNGVWWQRASIRYRSVPTYWYGNLGFRCASTD